MGGWGLHQGLQKASPATASATASKTGTQLPPSSGDLGGGGTTGGVTEGIARHRLGDGIKDRHPAATQLGRYTPSGGGITGVTDIPRVEV